MCEPAPEIGVAFTCVACIASSVLDDVAGQELAPFGVALVVLGQALGLLGEDAAALFDGEPEECATLVEGQRGLVGEHEQPQPPAPELRRVRSDLFPGSLAFSNRRGPIAILRVPTGGYALGLRASSS